MMYMSVQEQLIEKRGQVEALAQHHGSVRIRLVGPWRVVR
jgi:hypothetical protein